MTFRRHARLLQCVLAVWAASVATAESLPPPTYSPLPPVLAELFAAGQAVFETKETPATGLGPVFNAPSCATCHERPGTGGSSDKGVTRFGTIGPTGFDPLPERGGPVLEEHGIVTDACTVAGETVPPDAGVVTKRNTPALYGLGLIDTVTDREILRLAASPAENSDGINGRPNRVRNRIGRFGWKAQVVSLHQFTASAYLNELGITSPDFPADLPPQGVPVACDPAPDPEDGGSRIDAVTRFLLLLAPLPRPPPALRTGRVAFRVAGCDVCHTTRLHAGASHPVAALRGRRIPMYSDLLLHDMGPDTADGIAQGFASGSDFRTAPLWGVRESAPYLHDGAAITLKEAILLHGGEATHARARFLALSTRRQDAVIAFLRSL